MSTIKHYREINDAYDHILDQIVKMTDQPEKRLIRAHSEV